MVLSKLVPLTGKHFTLRKKAKEIHYRTRHGFVKFFFVFSPHLEQGAISNL